MAYEKHVGVYENIEKFNEDEKNLCPPWIAYIYQDGGYKVRYSSATVVEHTEFNAYEQLDLRLQKVENNIITLTEDEYDALVTLEEGQQMEITHVDGSKDFVSYDPNVYYYTYNPSDKPNTEV